jgi:hypothetical protein
MTPRYRWAVGTLLIFPLALLASLYFAATIPALLASQYQHGLAPASATGTLASGCPAQAPGAVSPDSSRVACGAECPLASNVDDFIAPCLAIFGRAGQQVLRSANLDDAKLGPTCTTSDEQWLDDQHVGLSCEYEPLLSQYLVVDARTGSIDQRFTGLSFRWSPDHQTLARIDVARLIGTPAGSNSCLYLGSRAVYPVAHPKDCEPHPKDIYDGIHTFLSAPEWSPDSRRVAVVVRIFDWEYEDPFGKYWEGTLSRDRYYLAIASVDQPAAGYPLKTPPALGKIAWLDSSRVTLDGQTFDLNTQPPSQIP